MKNQTQNVSTSSVRGILHAMLSWSCLLLLCLAPGLGCDDGNDGGFNSPDPKVLIFSFDINERSGFAPFDSQFSVSFTTADPRADVEVYIDYGDGTEASKVTFGTLEGEPDENNPKEFEEEVRTVTFAHTFEEPGDYTIRTWAVDTTNSRTGPNVSDPVEIRSSDQSVDITVTELPDLIAGSVSTEASVIELDESFDIDFEVLNDGFDVNRTFFVDVYLVKRADIRPAELVDSTVAIKLTTYPTSSDGIKKAQALNLSSTVKLCDPRIDENDCIRKQEVMGTGAWLPAILVDPPNLGRPELNVNEQDKDNNFRIGSTPVSLEPLLDAADLLPSNIVAQPQTTQVLRDVDVSFDVENIGDVASGAADYTIVLSEDKTFDVNDIVLGGGSSRPLQPDTAQNFAGLAFTLDEDIETPGEYWIIVTTDPDNVVPETDEVNNTQIAARAITVTGAQDTNADIEPYDLTVSPVNTYLGGRISLGFSVRNNGMNNSGSYQCTVLLSSDRTLEIASDRFLVQVKEDSLPGGSKIDFDREIVIPNSIGAGVYYAFVACDPNNQVAETNEDNNNLGPSSLIAVNALAQLDYVVSSLTVSPNQLTENEVLTFDAEICNMGSDTGGPVEVRAYLSTDGTITKDDRLVDSVVTTQTQIAPGACDTVQMAPKVNCLPFVNTYTPGIIIDPTNSIPEQDETNNVAAAAEITVNPDGATSICVCVEDADEGTGNDDEANATLVTLTGDPRAATIQNNSLCDDVDFYQIDLVRGDILTASLTHDSSLGDLELRVIDAATQTVVDSTRTGDTESITVELLEFGTNTVYIEVYPKNAGEKNYYTLDFSVEERPSEPELYVDNIDLITGGFVSVFDAYDYAVTINNDGLSDATGFSLKVYLSEDDTLDTAVDELLEDQAVASLATYATQTFNFSHSFDVANTTSGPRFIFAVVDADATVTEVDETNNELRSSSFSVDATCIPDGFEGASGNDDFDNAYVLRPGSGFTEYDQLNVCDNGRGDVYLVCAPVSEPLSHLAILQPDPAATSGMQIKVFDRDQATLGSASSTAAVVVSVPIPAPTCADDTECATGETCVGGMCQDGNGEHCVYLSAELRPTARVVSRDYSIRADAYAGDQIDEPANDDPETAPTYQNVVQSLAAGSGHMTASDDVDHYTLSLPSGTEFDVTLVTADQNVSLKVFVSGSSIGTTVQPEKLRTFTHTGNKLVEFRVAKGSAGSERPSAYRVAVSGAGVDGIELAPANLVQDTDIIPINASVLLDYEIANNRLEATTSAVDYRYVLSRDTTVDLQDDLVLGQGTAGSFAGFESKTLQEKVYARVSTDVFGDFNLILEVDYNDDHIEVDETNNSLIAPLTVLHSCSSDQAEPNESLSSPRVVTPPGVGATREVLDLALCPGDNDYFSLNLAGNAEIDIVIDNMVNYRLGDIDLFLFEEDGTFLAGSDQLLTLEESLSYTNPGQQPKKVIVQVVGFRPDHSNRYDLKITRVQ